VENEAYSKEKKMDCWNKLVDFIGRPRVEGTNYKLMDDEKNRVMGWSQL
jgi:hypothetical protein